MGLSKHTPACLPVFLHRRYTHMKKTILVVMAAGMGSRYGGLKQIDPAMNQH